MTLDAPLDPLALLHHQQVHWTMANQVLRTAHPDWKKLPRNYRAWNFWLQDSRLPDCLEDANPLASSTTIRGVTEEYAQPILITAPYPPNLVRLGGRWVINPEFYKHARYSSGRNPSDPDQRAFDSMTHRNGEKMQVAVLFLQSLMVCNKPDL
ncbi:hypothetical protein JB92DRAFT_2825310 [Gautieria morchelliformis]|nr:hypothetical protein JB92DRAFT_2825310 [Gautieria morchelliformis]